LKLAMQCCNISVIVVAGPSLPKATNGAGMVRTPDGTGVHWWIWFTKRPVGTEMFI
jgi:hypothetical protein